MKKTSALRVCRVCYWNSTIQATNYCTAKIPKHIGQVQILRFRRELIRKYSNLNCDKFLHRQQAKNAFNKQ